MNQEVAIYRYVTEGSFDAYMWQALETKARFIAQVMSGDCAVRKAEDIGGQELSYAEVKAIASGNPAVLTLAETDAELQRLAILQEEPPDEQYLARRNLRDLPDDIKRLDEAGGGPDDRHGDHGGERRHPLAGGGRRTHEADAREGERDLPHEARDVPRAGMRDHPAPAGRDGGLPRWRRPVPGAADAGQSRPACRAERAGTAGRRLRGTIAGT